MRHTAREYLNRDTNLDNVAKISEQFFREEGFSTQTVRDIEGYLIQAKKGGVFRTILAPDKAFTVLIEGEPNHFLVRMGVSEWVQELNSEKVKSFLMTPFLSFSEIPEAMWTYETEHHFWHNLETHIILGIQ